MLTGVFLTHYSINMCGQILPNFLMDTMVYSENAFDILKESIFFFPNSAILDIFSTSSENWRVALLNSGTHLEI